MHVSDLPSNPLWLLFTDSSHIAGLLAFGLFLIALSAVWDRDKNMIVATGYFLGGLFAVLAAYELSTSSTWIAVGFLSLAAVLMWLTMATLAYVMVRATANHNVATMLLSGFMTLSALALALELTWTTPTVADLANLFWWLTTVVGAFLLVGIINNRFRGSAGNDNSGVSTEHTNGPN